MVALWNRADYYIFILSIVLLLSSFFPRLISDVTEWMSAILVQVWNMLHAARWKYRTQKGRQQSPSGHHRTTLSGYIFATKPLIDNRKNLLISNIFSRCPYNMVNFGSLTAEIDWRVWGTPSYFNGYRVLAALLHGSQAVGVIQTLRRWTEGATYVRQGDHHVGHWPTF